jgi:collagenase-like PrtC family protease
MRLVIPTTFEPAFLDKLAGQPVDWLYGSLPQEPGARAKSWLPPANLEQMEAHFAHAKRLGMGFLYTMNAPCSGNRELTAEGQRALAERLGWLEEAGAAGVVAASPYVVEMIRRRYPGLRVCVSTLANVDSVDKALYYQDLGVESIYVPEYLNRDFRLLRALRKQVQCDLVICLNLGCLIRCPLRDYHSSFISHASESLSQGCYVDYSLARCTQMKALSPVEAIKGTWIRPEDVERYEALGYTAFKLAGREMGGEWLLRAVEAYTRRRYEGALNDLVIGLDALEPFGRLPLRIDNTRLDGFLAFFEKKDCRLGCAGCTHCQEYAERAVAIEDDAPYYGARIGRALRLFTSGTFRAPVVRS